MPAAAVAPPARIDFPNGRISVIIPGTLIFLCPALTPIAMAADHPAQPLNFPSPQG
ncbi:MAG: hypothetical protein RLZZ458_3462, partial [Planctomycetota bacterium]